MALDAIYLEQELLKESVGSQDQTATAFGGLNKIKFGGPEHIKVEPLAISMERKRLLEDHLEPFFTGTFRKAHEIF